MMEETPKLVHHTNAKPMPVGMETPHTKDGHKFKVPKVPPKRKETKIVKREEPGIKNLETEFQVTNKPTKTVKDEEHIPVAGSHVTRKLRHEIISNPVKQEQIEPVMPFEFVDVVTVDTVKEPARAGKTSPDGENKKTRRVKRGGIINCHCGHHDQKDRMLQCSVCLRWQHALCQNIQRESDVPPKYKCSICLNPPRARQPNDRDYSRYINQRSQELIGSVLKIVNAVNAVKLQHYMFYGPMGARKYKEEDVAKKSEERRLWRNSLESQQVLLGAQLDFIEKQVEELEYQAMESEWIAENSRINQLIQIILRDLDYIQELANIT